MNCRKHKGTLNRRISVYISLDVRFTVSVAGDSWLLEWRDGVNVVALLNIVCS
jgi:hypothetical protein